VIHEYPDQLHGAQRDGQTSDELPDVAPCPREDARPPAPARTQDLRLDFVREPAEAVCGVDHGRCPRRHRLVPPPNQEMSDEQRWGIEREILW
jgi:hypothetical protein